MALTPQIILALPTAPTSGQQITLLDSANMSNGAWTRKVIANLRSSHISAASGLEFQATWDNGATWNDIVAYTVPALTVGVPFSIYEVALNYPRWRIMYTNSANTLTTWQGNLAMLLDERAAP